LCRHILIPTDGSELAEHGLAHRRAGDAGIGAKDRIRLHDHLRGVLAELVAEDVAKGLPATRRASG
jgi:hypothetical protein